VSWVEGKVVAITGGARGIGLATADALTRRGALVHIGDLDGELARREALALDLRGGHPLDVTDRDSFAAFLDSVRAAEGQVNALINNAGVMPWVAFLDQEQESIDQTIAVNLDGVLHGMRLALPEMVERGNGHVVNVSSGAARTPIPGAAVYSGTKAAVVAITDAVRRELRDTGVALSCVLPTMVATELASGAPEGRGLRAIQPEDVAKTIAGALEGGGGTHFAGPFYADAASRLQAVLPRRVSDVFRSLLADDRILTSLDEDARAAYVERLEADRARQRKPPE
jgi:NADP-dependent 3-hydroxy acid dehydrogenase YdfG